MNPVTFVNPTQGVKAKSTIKPHEEPVVEAEEAEEENLTPTAAEINASFVSSNPLHRSLGAQVRRQDLCIDSRIQRKVNRVEVNRIKRKFNPMALQAITVSVREDNGVETERVILDGQQRWTACNELGYDVPLNAIVHYGLTLAEEAQLFEDLNFKYAIPAWEAFLVSLSGGNRLAVEIKEVLDNLNIPLGGAKGLSAVAVAKRVAGKPDGLLHLRWALTIIQKVYGGEDSKGPKTIYDGRVIEAFAIFHAYFGPRIQEERLIRMLIEAGKGLSGLLGTANTIREMRGGQMPVNIGDAISRKYNVGLQRGKKHWLEDLPRGNSSAAAKRAAAEAADAGNKE